MQCTCAILYCHLWAVGLYHTFPYYLINGTAFGTTLLNTKSIFSLQLMSEVLLILCRIQRGIATNVDLHRSSCEIQLLLSDLKPNLAFLGIFLKSMQILVFVKICPVGDKLFHADRQTGVSTDFTKLTAASRHFWNAPIKCEFCIYSIFMHSVRFAQYTVTICLRSLPD
jgi:hypothetical protein